MTLAMANVLEISINKLFLTFSPASQPDVIIVVSRRRLLQQLGVLVNASLKEFNGSIKVIQDKLNQDRINSQMAALGLKPIQMYLQNPTGQMASSGASLWIIVACSVGGIIVALGSVLAYIWLCKKYCVPQAINEVQLQHDGTINATLLVSKMQFILPILQITSCGMNKLIIIFHNCIYPFAV